MPVKRVLYDLAGADPGLRFSPYCWRIKLALAHKNLPYTTVAWRFTDKDEIAPYGADKVPVLLDGEHAPVADSQAIAEYLETAYPNEASLFGDPPSRALTKFIKAWAEQQLHPALARVALPGIFAKIAEQDKVYFRASREKTWGMKIEDFVSRQDEYLAALQGALSPLRTTLKGQEFVAGVAPSYADHIVWGALQWARLTAIPDFLTGEPEITAWMAAVLGTYGL
jgi:glutathione S-transferase